MLLYWTFTIIKICNACVFHVLIFRDLVCYWCGKESYACVPVLKRVVCWNMYSTNLILIFLWLLLSFTGSFTTVTWTDDVTQGWLCILSVSSCLTLHCDNMTSAQLAVRYSIDACMSSSYSSVVTYSEHLIMYHAKRQFLWSENRRGKDSIVSRLMVVKGFFVVVTVRIKCILWVDTWLFNVLLRRAIVLLFMYQVELWHFTIRIWWVQDG